ncbi:MAG: hypothetical protein M0006_05360 [Magnetospirillum sp.]|nr:hypothetical protein [Magnetospirillum sp.]
MKLKLDENGHAILRDGMPIYTTDAGKEVTFDAANLTARLAKAEAAVPAAIAIAQSPVTARLGLPADMVNAAFGSAFRIERGALIAHDADGRPLFSRKHPGEYAMPDEALEMLASRHPELSARLANAKASTATTTSPTGGAPANSNTLSRAAFDRLPTDARMAHIKAGGRITD